jgi:hypothetical protein
VVDDTKPTPPAGPVLPAPVVATKPTADTAEQSPSSDGVPGSVEPHQSERVTVLEALPEEIAAISRLSLAAGFTSLPASQPLAVAGWASTGGAMRVNDSLSLAGSRSELTLSSGLSGRQTTEVYDLSATIDAISIGEVSLALVGGLRVATEGPIDADATRMVITPVLGPALRWRRGPSEFRALILGDATGANEDFVEFRLEQVWSLTASSTLSMGYQHQRSLFQNAPTRTAETRDALTVELRLNF